MTKGYRIGLVSVCIAVAVGLGATLANGETASGPSLASLSKRVAKLEKRVRAIKTPTLKIESQSAPLTVSSNGIGTATVACTRGTPTGGGFEWTVETTPSDALLNSAPTEGRSWTATIKTQRTAGVVGNVWATCTSLEGN